MSDSRFGVAMATRTLPNGELYWVLFADFHGTDERGIVHAASPSRQTDGSYWFQPLDQLGLNSGDTVILDDYEVCCRGIVVCLRQGTDGRWTHAEVRLQGDFWTRPGVNA